MTAYDCKGPDGQHAHEGVLTACSVVQVVKERNLQLHTTWLNKCIQLYETYLVRHGIMLVGPAGSGKTAICECLAAALTELGTKHVCWRMNPKVICTSPWSPISSIEAHIECMLGAALISFKRLRRRLLMQRLWNGRTGVHITLCMFKAHIQTICAT